MFDCCVTCDNAVFHCNNLKDMKKELSSHDGRTRAFKQRYTQEIDEAFGNQRRSRLTRRFSNRC